MRARARAAVPENVSSPRATPTPETAESPIARIRRHLPRPGMNPQYGGRARGKDGIRRRVTVPCNATNGNSASEPRTPAASLTRDRGLPEPENTSVRARAISATVVYIERHSHRRRRDLERINPNRSQTLKLENHIST